MTITTPHASPAPTSASAPAGGGVLLAALLLPGLAALACAPVLAQTAPEHTTIGLNMAAYEDGQPGWDRVKVYSPQLYLQTPLSSDWSLEGHWIGDTISGATPRAHTQRSGASVMHEERAAGDVTLTRYLDQVVLSTELSVSDEHDFRSYGLGLNARYSTPDRNRTWSLGLSTERDRIDNTYSGVDTAINQLRHTHALMAGVTQVLGPLDLVQLNLTRDIGRGYFNDPYKSFDQRPDRRNASIVLAAWNHHLPSLGATLRSSYRYYDDTFGIHSHTASVEWVQPAGAWTFTPGLRYYNQSAARFYLDPVLDAQGHYDANATLLRALAAPGDKSLDQRLAAYGALTASLKVGYAVSAATDVEFKLERYRQGSGLRWGGAGSPGLDPFHANLIQLGLVHRF